METCSCDRLADMLMTVALILVFYPVARALALMLGLDNVAERAVDLVFKYHNWLWAGVFLIGAWWLFWR